MRRRLVGSLLLGLAVVGLGACRERRDGGRSDDDDDASFVEEGTEATAVESDAHVLTSSLVSAAPGGAIGLASAELSAADVGPREIGDGARATFGPRSCLTIQHDSATRTVTYVFAGCVGPHGLRAVTGTVVARYAHDGSTLHLDLTADDLAVNGARVDWAATADITAPSPTDAQRTMVWKATLSGTTGGGRSFERSSEATVGWTLAEPCFSVTATSDGTIARPGGGGERQIRTEITDFRRCRRGCPDAGGRITVTNVSKNKRIELLYDGTNRATFVGPDGTEKSVQLFCR